MGYYTSDTSSELTQEIVNPSYIIEERKLRMNESLPLNTPSCAETTASPTSLRTPPSRQASPCAHFDGSKGQKHLMGDNADGYITPTPGPVLAYGLADRKFFCFARVD